MNFSHHSEHYGGNNGRIRIGGHRTRTSWFDDLILERLRRRANAISLGSCNYSHFFSYNGVDSATTPRRTVCEEPTAPDPSPKTLTVKAVDLLIGQNAVAHHTSEYEHKTPRLVLRRGQHFNMAVQFSRDYDPQNDDLRLVFEAGLDPMKSKGTRVEILLSDVDVDKKWGAKILSHKGSDLTVTVFTPPTLFIGKWSMNIEVVEKDEESVNVYSYEHPHPFIFIFNPWCKDDPVYMEKELHLDEYVMSETGRIYVGSAKQVSSRPWVFGQFDPHVLDVALYLLEAGGLKWSVRGQPIAVVRKLTAMVNSSDDNGVLTGNWSGDYSGGVSPSKWTGSPSILQQYWREKRPVRYGQCWVFSGVTTTVMRALGIPARSVTNFASAHDTDGSITIDYNFDLEGNSLDNSDSIWNFHVWNEVWMSRDDLPPGYGGWQVCDSTPQEASDGIYVCGPVSVQAIRQGEVNLPFDAPFVFAEVNADIVYWQEDGYGGMNYVQLEAKSVGKFISTKQIDEDKREDITLCYKPPEGSAEERTAVRRANQTGSTAAEGVYDTSQVKDVIFTVEQDCENTWVGEDFVINLHIQNTSHETRSINGRAVVKTMFYTGVTSDKLLSGPFSVRLEAGKEHLEEVRVKPEDYVKKLKDGCMLDVTFWAQIVETKQIFTSKQDYRLRKPHLTIKAPKQTVTSQEFKVDVSFVNPLPTTLTDCELSVGGLARELTFPQGQVGAKGTFSASVPITATKKGHKELVVVFSSKQLDNINGVHPIFIRAA